MTVTTGGPALPLQQGVQLNGRISAVRAEMRRRDLTALAVVSPESIYYLSGLDYQGYFAFSMLLLPLEGSPLLVTRAMEAPTVRAQAPECVHVPYQDGQDPVPVAAGLVRAYAGPGETLGVEDSAMFFPPRLWNRLRSDLKELHWADTSDLVNRLRQVKTPDEVSLVRRAASLSDAAMIAGVGSARPGAYEAQVAAAVYQAMLSAGSQPPGFAPLIRATAVLQQEHVSWSEREIVPGDGLFLELSASVRRYHAPLSRTIYIGTAPPEARIAHEASVAGLHGILGALRPGAVAGDVYRAWEASVAQVRPQLDAARHHCGYLVGIGFPPSWVGGGEVMGIRPDCTRIIRPGMTFHAMSWVTDPIGHVTSDTVLVTEDGCERLTTVPHGLTVVG